MFADGTPISPDSSPAQPPAVATTTTTSTTSKGIVTTVQTFAIDVAGLGFVGAAIYGYVTGKITGGSLEALTALAAMYLGVKVPS